MRVLGWPVGGEEDLNPYTRLVFSAFAYQGATLLPFMPLMRRVPDADVFHVQWAESIFEGRAGGVAPLAWFKAWRVLRTAARVRSRGGAVVLTVHNLHPHKTPANWRRWLWRRFHDALLHQVNLLVGLSPGGLEAFQALHPIVADVAGVVIPHPHYRGIYAEPSRVEARAVLGLDGAEPVLVIAGSLRPSKRTPEAVSVFRAMRGSGQMLVAGAATDNHWAEIVAAANGDPAVRLLRGALSNAGLAAAVAAADAVLVNQPGTLNSGTALLALSLGRPVIAPAVGAMTELAATVGASWMHLFDPPLDTAALRACLDRLAEAGVNERPNLDALDPFAVSRQLLAAYRNVLAQRVRQPDVRPG